MNIFIATLGIVAGVFGILGIVSQIIFDSELRKIDSDFDRKLITADEALKRCYELADKWGLKR